MRETFVQAAERDHRAVFLIIHANPRFEKREDEPKGPYAIFLQALEEEVVRFGRPVALAHGDSHYFRVDKPLRQAATGPASRALHAHRAFRHARYPLAAGNRRPSRQPYLPGSRRNRRSQSRLNLGQR